MRQFYEYLQCWIHHQYSCYKYKKIRKRINKTRDRIKPAIKEK